jgi:hypothetical protein
LQNAQPHYAEEDKINRRRHYQVSLATTTSGSNLMILPEFGGGLVALAACFAVFARYMKRGTLFHSSRNQQ